jgi:hypothetical protein
MTSLQQTAMLGGAASAKVASYTLVAADAGTAITMSNAGATTITVNTALFAAGDTVQITNLGAGVCTITAGTATVNTASSLALAQYESGTLDFDSTSSAVFIKGAGAAAASGSYTLLSTTSITSTSTTVSSISQSYQDLFIEIYGITFSTSNSTPFITINASGNSNVRAFLDNYGSKSGTNLDLYGGSTDWLRTSANNYYGLQIRNYTTTDRYKSLVGAGVTTDSASAVQPYGWTGTYTANTAISQLSVALGGGRTFSTGTIKVWGIK